MSMKTPPQWNISSRVIILIFITQEFLFLSDGVRVSGAQLMVSPAPLADIAVDDLTECAFPLDTFQNRTTSLPISCSLEGGRIWFTLRLKNSGQMYYNFLGSKAWHRREKCPRNKQVDSKQMLEGRPKFQESSWMKEVWNNNWYNSMLLHIRHNWDVFCLPKISNQCASLVHTIKTFSSSWTQASDHLQGSRSSLCHEQEILLLNILTSCLQGQSLYPCVWHHRALVMVSDPSAMCPWITASACSHSKSRNQTKTKLFLARTHDSIPALMTFAIWDPRSNSYSSTWKEFLGGEHPAPCTHTRRKTAHVFIQPYQWAPSHTEESHCGATAL